MAIRNRNGLTKLQFENEVFAVLSEMPSSKNQFKGLAKKAQNKLRSKNLIFHFDEFFNAIMNLIRQDRLLIRTYCNKDGGIVVNILGVEHSEKD